MKLIRLELTLIIVETNTPSRVRVPPPYAFASAGIVLYFGRNDSKKKGEKENGVGLAGIFFFFFRVVSGDTSKAKCITRLRNRETLQSIRFSLPQ